MASDNKAFGVGSAVLVVVIAAGIYFYKFAAPTPAPAEPAPVPAAPVAAPAAPPAEPLPKLEESDAFARSKAASLSTDPAFAAWLKTDDLLPRLAAAVNLVGQGKIPKDSLSFMAPRRKFSVRAKGGTFFADPSGFRRYDAAAGAIASIDAGAAAGLFQKYRLLFQEAYQGTGEPGDVQDAVARAAQELLKTPMPSGPVPLKEKGIVYAYVDDSLERLSPAQKLLLRMGPRNEAKVQAKLRELVAALGVPSAAIPK